MDSSLINKDQKSIDSKPKQLSANLSLLLTLGLGLHTTWVCATVYSTKDIFDISYSFTEIFDLHFSLVYLLSALAFGITCLLTGAFDQKLTRFSRSRKVMLLAAIITFFGGAFGLASSLIPALSFVCECLSGVLTGIGSATLLQYWAIAYSREDSKLVIISGAAAIVFGITLYSLIVRFLPLASRGFIVTIIPIVEFILLHKVSPLPQDSRPRIFHLLPTNKSRFALSYLVPIALIGLSMGVLKHLSTQSVLGSEASSEGVIILFMADSMVLVLFLIYGLNQSDFSEQRRDWFLRLFIPTLACLALLFSLILGEDSSLSNLFILVAYIIIEILMWIIFACISHSTDLSPIFLFGVVRGIFTLSISAGGVAVIYAEPFIEESLFLIILTIVAFLAIGFALMPRISDILRKIAPCPLVNLVSFGIESNIDMLSTIKMAAPLTQQQEGNQQFSSEAEAPVSDARMAMNQTRAANNDTQKTLPKRFTHKVKRVAQTYQLTKRETDILFELAKGNSPTFIQEKYFISAGTVKTHIRNIYRKLNVHKRQELMRLIDEFESYDSPDSHS